MEYVRSGTGCKTIPPTTHDLPSLVSSVAVCYVWLSCSTVATCFVFLTVPHGKLMYMVAVWSRFITVLPSVLYGLPVLLRSEGTDCFTAVVDKVNTLIKTVCCLFAVGLRRVNGRRESWQLRKAQGSPAFQHIVLVSDSARRESSARSAAGSIGWVVHLLKPSYSFFLLPILKYLLGT